VVRGQNLLGQLFNGGSQSLLHSEGASKVIDLSLVIPVDFGIGVDLLIHFLYKTF
jgi:hypothetical protein